jgi:uncharacterized protein
MQVLAPVKAGDREIFMDVLRGFAILGIFIANLGSGLSWYNEQAHATGPYLVPEWDHRMTMLHHWFIEGKFYSIFSLLFGWGIALQIKRGMAGGGNPLATIRRRLFFMLLLGALHLLIWPGDIVFFYAMLGFLLLPLRRFSNKTLLITGGILVLSPILLYWLKMTWPQLNYPADWLNNKGMQVTGALTKVTSDEDFMRLMRKGNWWDQLKINIGGFFWRYGYLIFVSRVPKVLGMFLIGYVVGRSDFYKNITQHKKLLYWTMSIGYAVGIPANYMLSQYMGHHMMEYFSLKKEGLYQTIVYALGVAPLAMAYVATLMLLFQKGMCNKILSRLAPVGKMAFSNYMLQSLAGNFVFLGAGLGLMGQIGPVYYTLLGIGFFILQVIISTIWLKYFNYGPVEWVWRSATYKKWQSMLKKKNNS